MNTLKAWGLASTLVLFACGGTTSNVLGGAGTDGGQQGTGSCDNVTGVSGHWNILGSSSNSAQQTATLTIDANTFAFSTGNTSLIFNVVGHDDPVMTLTWTAPDHANGVPITTVRSPAALNLGLLPLQLGGQWNFASAAGDETCAASLGAAGFSATCGQIKTPLGSLKGTLLGQRTQTLPSLFGDFGGTWLLTANGGGGANVTIAGNSFAATLTRSSNRTNGSVNLKVCDGTLSGTTGDGYEFAGTRF